jgi:AraC-like DNA-binding protein
VADGRHSQIRQAVQYLTEHFHEAFSVKDLAENVGTSPSSFYDHFREATMMTPLQFRNQPSACS